MERGSIVFPVRYELNLTGQLNTWIFRIIGSFQTRSYDGSVGIVALGARAIVRLEGFSKLKNPMT
jgi:hypothetical protein